MVFSLHFNITLVDGNGFAFSLRCVPHKRVRRQQPFPSAILIVSVNMNDIVFSFESALFVFQTNYA